MKNIDQAISRYKGLYSGEAIARMQSFYKGCDSKLEKFVKLSDSSCPSGCGQCCKHYHPFVKKAEALYIAAYILFSDEKDFLSALLEKDAEENSPFCPLYDDENPHHCRIYPARPLTCRLFGSCCYTKKDGSPAPSRCRFNSEKKTPEIKEKHRMHIPQMEYFGMMLEQINPDSGEEPLSKAVLKEMERLCLEEMLQKNGA